MYDMPIVGYRVVGLDHRVVGAVSNLGRKRFEVRAPHGAFWLKKAAVFTAVDGVVTLVCNADNLGPYVVNEDEPASGLAATDEAGLSTESP